MATRGLRVYRFRKRYYVFYNHYDSYPDGLGEKIVAEIPKNAAEYQGWLSMQRAFAADWAAQYEKAITIGLKNEVDCIHEESCSFMHDHSYPSYLAPVNDVFIEWTYTLDLDHESFTVSNGAHFSLALMPHINWIDAVDAYPYQIALPGFVPAEAVVSLVAEDHSASSMLSTQMWYSKSIKKTNSELPVLEAVTPKDLDSIPWCVRHGVTLRAQFFQSWSKAMEDTLAATLLQLTPRDLIFREIAYAMLCLAAGGHNMSVIPTSHLSTNEAFGFFNGEKSGTDEYSEFLSMLGSGAHRVDTQPGSAPDEQMYWLDGVFVVLLARLYGLGVIQRELRHLAEYCETHYPDTIIDAVLISIEHIVLVHIVPRNSDTAHCIVQHSSILPLMQFEEHTSMHPAERLTASCLKTRFEVMQRQRKRERREFEREKRAFEREQRKRKHADITQSPSSAHDVEEPLETYNDTNDPNEDDGQDERDEKDRHLHPTRVEGSPITTFYGLCHLFSAVVHRTLPPIKSASAQGCFPTEIYENIISYVTDSATRNACLDTSRTLRDICQQEHLFCESDGGLILKPKSPVKRNNHVQRVPKAFNLYNLTTGKRSHTRVKILNEHWDKIEGTDYFVAIGKEHGKRSLLPHLTLRLKSAEDKEGA